MNADGHVCAAYQPRAISLIKGPTEIMRTTTLALLTATVATFCSAATASATLQYITNVVSGQDARYEQETDPEYNLTQLRISYSAATGSVAAHAEHGLLAFEGRIAGRTDNLTPSGTLYTEGQVSFADVLKIDVPGRAGQTGIVRIAYRVDGSIVLNGNTAFTNAGYFVSTGIRSTAGGADDFAGYRRFANGTSEGQDVLGTRREVTSRFVFGQDFDFGVGLNNLDVRLTMQSEADASNSAALSIRYLVEGVVSVTDVDGNPISEFEISSRTGREYGPRVLWSAGGDLALNEKPDRGGDAQPVNETVPQWSYGYRNAAAGTALTPFTPGQHFNNVLSRPGLDGWDSGGDAGVTVIVNATASDITLNFGSGNLRPLLPGQILFDPSVSGTMPVLRWTAPAAGRYNIVARWLDLDTSGGDGVSCHAVVNGTERFTQNIDNGESVDMPLTTVELKAGDVIDFLVGARGNFSFDATGFNGAITRAPAVDIAVGGAENGRGTVQAGEAVSVTATAPFGTTVKSLELRDNGKVVGRAETAPHTFTLENINPGMHLLQAVVIDGRGAEGASNQVELTAVQPGAGASSAKRRPGSESTAKAATAGTTYFSATAFGSWSDPNSWTPRGVPGPNDDAFILGDGNVGSTIFLQSKFEVANLIVGAGSKLIGAEFFPRFDVGVTATKTAFFNDCDLEGFELAIGPGAEMTTNEPPRFKNVAIFNNGSMTVMGGGKTIGDAVTELKNSGSINIRRPPGANRGSELDLPAVQHNGGLVAVQDGSKLVSGNVVVNGEVKLGGGLIGMDGASLIGMDGASLIGLDGASLIGMDGASLIGLDGASLVGPDGASLIGLDGASVISTGGNGIEKAAGPAQTRGQRAASAGNGIVLGPGAVLTGTGNLVGDVTNQAGFVAPGSSAGVIRIVGNYTQQQEGTLVLELAGTTANPPQFDQLQVRGTATLGGKLVAKTINGFTPQSGDAVSPLAYNGVSGSFSSVTSNAQVAFDANSMTMQVSGPNPPAPKALNIATRMRVETGDNVLIAGFIISGDQPKRVLIRGIGPSLPVNGALADPTLDLDAGAFFNDDWKSNQEGEIRETTIPPSSDLEAAIVATLDPGAHTAVLRGKNDGTGVGLVEVYDLETGSPVALANISTRGQVQTGDNVMIGGFIIGGNYPAKVLLRAIGPSLPVEGALQDPTLELVDSNGATISNDNWREMQEAEIIATTVPPTNDREAAIVATLVPGAYTAVVRGKDDTVGVALVEGYNLQ